MKKSFQLSAVAIAIAASSSVMAATVAKTGANFSQDSSVNGINVNGTATGPTLPGTSKTVDAFDVRFTGAVTIDPADTDSAILTSVFGSQPVPAGAAVTHNADGTKTITYQVANNTIQTVSSNVNTSSQIINDQKIELSGGISTTKTESDFSGKTVTLKYTPTAPGSNNFVGSYPTPVVPTVKVLDTKPLSQDSITVGKKDAGADNALTVTSTVTSVDATGTTTTTTTESVVKASGITTSRINGNGTNGALVLHGGTNSTTQTLDDNGVSFVTTNAAHVETGRTTIDANGNLTVKGVNVTDAINAATTDRAAIRNEAAAETVRVNKAIVDGDAATLASAKGYTDTTATTLRSEAAAETVRVNKAIVDGDAATLTSAKGYTDTTATTLRSEAAAETVRVNKAIVDGDAATLTSAKGYTDTKSAATLASANAYTDGRANQLNTRIDDVQRTAYRGIAISLAAQQAVPSIGPGQVAIFGGVGHYEGETAGSIGVVTAFTDRLSASGAFGFAGGNEFGGRVGVAYVFGGK